MDSRRSLVLNDFTHGRIVRVIEPYVTPFKDPIELKTGDRVMGRRRDTEYPDYVWCVAPDGREDWIPERCVHLGDQE